MVVLITQFFIFVPSAPFSYVQSHITFTKLKHNGSFFSHRAPEAVQIKTDVSSISILEENMELFK